MGSINLVYIVLWFIVFLFSLSVHESAHAWTSDQFGDDTGRMLGRVSLNPIVHIDPLGTIVFPLIGLFGGLMFGWAKPVPVNPMNWREKDKANFWVSAAGPLSNFALVTIFFVILKILLVLGVVTPMMLSPRALTDPSGTLMVPFAQLLFIGVQLNIILGIFNLIPIPPLDGSGVLESILPANAREGYEQIKPFGFVLLIALLMTGILGFLIFPVLSIVYQLLLGY